MIRNYLTIALRNLWRNKTYSLINITGLAVGMACCLLILLWVQDEFRFDRFHANRNRIHQVYSELKHPDGRTQVFTGSYYPLAKTLENEVPEILNALRYNEATSLLVGYGDKITTDNTVGFADPGFFEIFSFPFLVGNPETALSDQNSIVITERMAQKYFGDEEPMGKTLDVQGRADLYVTGVIKDVPYHSSMQFDCIIPFTWQFGTSSEEPTHWGGNPLITFILLNENADLSNVAATINDIFKKYSPSETVQVDFHLHPLTRLHLYSPGGGGLILSITVSSIIALFVLIIACINFINLTTARSATRSNEVGLRKVVGAEKSDLIIQFLSESILMSIVTLTLAVVLVWEAIPAFNNLMSKQLSINLLLQPLVLLGVIGIALFTGILSGSYPALFLSSFQPVQTLKGASRYGARNYFFRKVLVVFQFTISIFLIIGTVVSYRQMNFVQRKDLGYDPNDVLCIRMIESLTNQYETVKYELLRDPNIVTITRSVQHPTNIGSAVRDIDWDGKNPDESVSMNFEYVDYEYFKTLGIEIIEGRSFSREYPTDLTNGYVVNEEAVRLMGIESPVGKRLSVFRQEGQIIGVVRDFHFQPLHEPIRPFVIGADPNWDKNWMFIKLGSDNRTETLEYIKATCNIFTADDSFMNFHFLDNALDYSYRAERQIGQYAGYFTVLAVLISCLGLFGLASFTAQQRTREIGIRKVVGASVTQVVGLLSKEFLILVIIANVIAWPIAWFAMRRWLENFAYRIDLGVGVFILAGLLALIIALTTVSWQTIRAATANPVEALRYE